MLFIQAAYLKKRQEVNIVLNTSRDSQHLVSLTRSERNMLQSRHKDVQLHFITSTDSVNERKIDEISRQLIRSIAGKHGKTTTPPGTGKQQEADVQEYQLVKRQYTSKIKLKSWERKSGRQAKKGPTNHNKSLHVEIINAKIEHRISDFSVLLAELKACNPLPISFFPGTAELMSYWHCGFITNAFALNPEGDW
jgi:hypothetical protein